MNTRYVDEQELFGAVATMCQLRANRLAALDPDRNAINPCPLSGALFLYALQGLFIY